MFFYPHHNTQRKMRINVTFSIENLTDVDVDVDVLETRYIRLLTLQISEAYPDANINVSVGGGTIEVVDNDGTVVMDHVVSDHVRHLAERVCQSEELWTR